MHYTALYYAYQVNIQLNLTVYRSFLKLIPRTSKSSRPYRKVAVISAYTLYSTGEVVHNTVNGIDKS